MELLEHPKDKGDTVLLEDLGLLQGQAMVLDLMWDKETVSVLVMEDLQGLSHSLKWDMVDQVVVLVVGLGDMGWSSLDNVTNISI